MRQNTDAEAALKRAIDLSPTLLPAREELAELYGRLGRSDERLTQLEALVALDPGPARSIELGLAYSRAGMTDRAVSTLRQASERYHDAAGVDVALGRVWLEAAQLHGDRIALAKALEALEGAVGSDDSSEALTLFGRALLLASDQELAERMLQDATTQGAGGPARRSSTWPTPRNAASTPGRAPGAGRLPHPDRRRARRAATGRDGRTHRRAVHARPGRAGGGDLVHARARCRRSDAVILVHLAQAQIAAGDRDAARQTVARALEHEPQNAAARALARQLR